MAQHQKTKVSREYGYRYQLERGIGKRKHTCPNCGRKNTFSLYVDTLEGGIVGDEYGICDRKFKCKYHNPPGIDKLNQAAKLLVPVASMKKAYQEPTQIHTLSPTYVSRSMGRVGDNFREFLLSKFAPRLVYEACSIYRIGREDYWGEPATMFWQIDQDFSVRTGKVMLYNPETGSRVKEPYNKVAWAHNPTKDNRWGDNNTYLLQQCFFGEHLLSEYPEIDRFHVYESEKTAVIVYIWQRMMGTKTTTLPVATGGIYNINENSLLPFMDKRLIFFPDKGEANKEWENRVSPFKKDWDIVVSSYLEGEDIALEEGDDMADLILDVLLPQQQQFKPTFTQH